MKRLSLNYKGLSLFVIVVLLNIFFSCYSYVPVRHSYLLNLSEIDPGVDSSVNDSINNRILYRNKYFITSTSSSPEIKINNMAVALALEGKYLESLILFRESLEYSADKSPALNNLALVYELQNKNKLAFKMYTLALMEKDNYIIKKNLLSMKSPKSKGRKTTREDMLKDKPMYKNGEESDREEKDVER